MENTETINNMGMLADDAYNNAFFVEEVIEELSVRGYEVLATSPESSNGFQALLLEKTDPNPNIAGSQYVFAFRGTQVGLSVPGTVYLIDKKFAPAILLSWHVSHE